MQFPIQSAARSGWQTFFPPRGEDFFTVGGFPKQAEQGKNFFSKLVFFYRLAGAGFHKNTEPLKRQESELIRASLAIEEKYINEIN
ncbi:MAG: hypothetical protein ACLFUF_04240 [Opitutales bacterium]